MKVHVIFTFFTFLSLFASAQHAAGDVVVGQGQMPNVARDVGGRIHIVYGKGDSIRYVYSTDGKTFSAPALIDVLPGLFASAMRGPQIAAAANGLLVTACTKSGNIYAYSKSASGKWTRVRRLNDENGAAKEALMALSADGPHAWAVWLNAKKTRGQEIYGARSTDGGKTWSRNILVYASPDSTVCECCKPSVAVKGNNVYVMFRNWIKGSRDLYLALSLNGGKSFTPTRLGTGTWKLNGCPMDGGGLAINKGIPATVWRREGKIYAAMPGEPEKEIGEGRSCSMEVVGDRNVYAWTENGHVVVFTPGGVKASLGKGMLPQLKALENRKFVCIWENEDQIHSAVVTL